MLFMVRRDILIVIGVLIAAWFIKVIAVFIYLTYTRSRSGQGDEQGTTNPRAKLARTPQHIIAALPVMPYSSLAMIAPTAHYSSSSSSSDGAAAATEQQQQQQGVIGAAKGVIGQLPWRRSTDWHSPSQQQQQQQQQGVTDAGKQSFRFNLRLSLDSALRKQQQQQQIVAAAAVGDTPLPEHSTSPPPPPAAAEAAAAPDSEADTCAICFCDFEGPQWVKQLPCGHYYHEECIDTWLKKGTTCPLCKRPVWEEEEAEEQQQEEGQQQQQQQQQQVQEEGHVVLVVEGSAAAAATAAEPAVGQPVPSSAAATAANPAAGAAAAAAAAAAADSRHVVVAVQ